jgi:hypothetical protein
MVKKYQHRAAAPKPKVASCSVPTSTTYYLPADQFEYAGSIDVGMTGEPDLFFATTRWKCDTTYDGRIVHTVTRQDTPLLYVKELAPGTPRSPAKRSD